MRMGLISLIAPLLAVPNSPSDTAFSIIINYSLYYNVNNNFSTITITELRLRLFRAYSRGSSALCFKSERDADTFAVLHRNTPSRLRTSCMEFNCYGREIINYIAIKSPNKRMLINRYKVLLNNFVPNF